MTNLYCARCGTATVPGERYCGECGNDLTLPGTVTNAPPLRPGIPPTTPPYQQAAYIPPTTPPYQQATPGYQGYQSTTVATTKKGSPLPLIIGLVIVIAILAAGAYFIFLNKTSSNNSVVANQPTVTPNVALVIPTNTPNPLIINPTDTPNLVTQATNTPGRSSDDTAIRQEITDAVATMNAMTGFHAHLQGTISGTEVVLDGDFSKDGSQFQEQYGGSNFSAIYVNNAGYTSTDNGTTWQNDTQDYAKVADTVYNLLNGFAVDPSDTITNEGQETMISGDRADMINLVRSSGSYNDTFWIIDNSGNKTIARVALSGGGDNITVDYSKFNEPVNITAPNVSQ